jgi:hypothetical protein
MPPFAMTYFVGIDPASESFVASVFTALTVGR